MALSPDGNRLVFVALAADGTRNLWVRRFDAVESRLIEGSEDAHHPFWSPDGTSIGYFAHNKLKRIAEAGGVPQDDLRCRAGARGGTWNRDGVILFSSFGHAIAAGAGHGWSADARHRTQSIASGADARLAGVPRRRASLSLPGAQQRSGTNRLVPGIARDRRRRSASPRRNRTWRSSAPLSCP